MHRNEANGDETTGKKRKQHKTMQLTATHCESLSLRFISGSLIKTLQLRDYENIMYTVCCILASHTIIASASVTLIKSYKSKYYIVKTTLCLYTCMNRYL